MFSLPLPAAWYLWDPDPATRRASGSKAVDERVAGDPALAACRDRLVDILVGFGEAADERGAVAAATLWERAALGPVAANLMVFAGERSEDDDADEILKRLDRPHPGDLRPGS